MWKVICVLLLLVSITKTQIRSKFSEGSISSEVINLSSSNSSPPRSDDAVVFTKIPLLPMELSYFTANINGLIQDNTIKFYFSKSNDRSRYIEWIACTYKPSESDGSLVFTPKISIRGNNYLVMVYSRQTTFPFQSLTLNFFHQYYGSFGHMKIQVKTTHQQSSTISIDFGRYYQVNQINVVLKDNRFDASHSFIDLYISQSALVNPHDAINLATRCVFIPNYQNYINTYLQPGEKIFSYSCSNSHAISAHYVYLIVNSNTPTHIPAISADLYAYNKNNINQYVFKQTFSLLFKGSSSFSTFPSPPSSPTFPSPSSITTTHGYMQIDGKFVVYCQLSQGARIEKMEVRRKSGPISPNYFTVYAAFNKICKKSLAKLVRKSTFYKAESHKNVPSSQLLGQECQYEHGHDADSVVYRCNDGLFQQVNFFFNTDEFSQDYKKANPNSNSFTVSGVFEIVIFMENTKVQFEINLSQSVQTTSNINTEIYHEYGHGEGSFWGGKGNGRASQGWGRVGEGGDSWRCAGGGNAARRSVKGKRKKIVGHRGGRKSVGYFSGESKVWGGDGGKGSEVWGGDGGKGSESWDFVDSEDWKSGGR